MSTIEQSLQATVAYWRACQPATLRQLIREYEAVNRTWAASLVARILADPNAPVWEG